MACRWRARLEHGSQVSVPLKWGCCLTGSSEPFAISSLSGYILRISLVVSSTPCAVTCSGGRWRDSAGVVPTGAIPQASNSMHKYQNSQSSLLVLAFCQSCSKRAAVEWSLFWWLFVPRRSCRASAAQFRQPSLPVGGRQQEQARRQPRSAASTARGIRRGAPCQSPRAPEKKWNGTVMEPIPREGAEKAAGHGRARRTGWR